MILFYDKTTGDIVGTINQRVHPESHLNMSIGGDNVDRIVCNWKPVKWYDKTGRILHPEHIKQNPHLGYSADFEPDVAGEDQKEIIYKLDRKEIKPRDLRVDLSTNNLVYR